MVNFMVTHAHPMGRTRNRRRLSRRHILDGLVTSFTLLEKLIFHRVSTGIERAFD
jgi:hypothetical protein